MAKAHPTASQRRAESGCQLPFACTVAVGISYNSCKILERDGPGGRDFKIFQGLFMPFLCGQRRHVGLEMSRLTMDRPSRSCARLALRPCSPLLSDVQRSRSQTTLALSKTLPDFGLRRSPMVSVTEGVCWANSRASVGFAGALGPMAIRIREPSHRARPGV